MTSSARTIRRPLLGSTAAAAAGSSAASRSCSAAGADLGQLRLQPRPDGGVGAGEVELVEDGADVQPRPADEQRHGAGRPEPVDLGAGEVAVLGHGRRSPARARGRAGDAARPRRSVGVGLRRPDVHAAVELHGVGVDHLAAEPPGELDGERGLAGGGRADDGDDRGQRASRDGPVGDEVADAERRGVAGAGGR